MTNGVLLVVISCCWATRIVYRDYVKDTNFIGIDNDEFGNENRTKAIFFEIELKGLGRFGKKSDGLLEDSIRGYE